MPGTPHLLIREWVVAACFLILMATLCFMTQGLPKAPSAGLSLSSTVRIAITGGVENPGFYEFPRGVTYKEIFEMAQLTEQAKTRGIRMNKKIYQDTSIHIAEMEMIEVAVSGAVEKSGSYHLMKGSKGADLLRLAVPLDGANTNGLKRRTLEDGEEMVVPAKKVQKKHK